MKIINVFLVFFLFIISCKSQEFVLKGNIVDSITKEPIALANIYLYKNDSLISSTISDFDGTFTLNPVPSNNCFIRINCILYKEKKIFLKRKSRKKSWWIINNILLVKSE